MPNLSGIIPHHAGDIFLFGTDHIGIDGSYGQLDMSCALRRSERGDLADHNRGGLMAVHSPGKQHAKPHSRRRRSKNHAVMLRVADVVLASRDARPSCFEDVHRDRRGRRRDPRCL